MIPKQATIENMNPLAITAPLLNEGSLITIIDTTSKSTMLMYCALLLIPTEILNQNICTTPMQQRWKQTQL